jgi:Tetratricopeptide repeat
MRKTHLAICIAAICIPSLALAIPPRDKQQRPGGQQQQRPGGGAHGPSLTPANRPGGGGGQARPGGGGGGNQARQGGQPGRGPGIPPGMTARPGGGSPGRPGGGPGMGGGNRPGGPSLVANRPADRPGQNPQRPAGGAFPGQRPGDGNRPNNGNRPGVRPGEWARPGNRPEIDRPGGNRPGADMNRPGVDFSPPYIGNNRPDLRPNVDINNPNVAINRPNVNVNRPVINRPDINVNRPVTVNRPITNIDNTVINQNVVNRTVNQTNIANRNVYGRQVGGYSANPYPNYYNNLHYGWQPTTAWGNYQPMYSNYYSGSTGYATNWLGSAVANYAYANPFYAAQSTAGFAAQPATNTTNNLSMQVYDYSQPIRVPQADYQETNDDLVRSEQAIRRFDDARELFRRGEYGRANDAVDEAVKLLPSDPTLHQLRGLILFARQRFSDAAAAIYSVLAVSPGWDWDTVSNLYDDPKRYEEQLRELEKYAMAHPEATDAQFLLGYHATVLGDAPMAEAQLELVQKAKPSDRLTENLLAALRQPPQQQ